jgi:hypothetical protein
MRGAIALVLVCGLAGAARAECTAVDRHGDPYATCFSPGNRLVLEVALDGDGGDLGAGGEIAVRRTYATVDPGITWRLEHHFARTLVAAGGWRATLYDGRAVRHARDGYLTLPTSPPRRFFLPFDVGAEATLLDARGRSLDEEVKVGLVRVGALGDLARADSFRRRVSLAVVLRWDADVTTASLVRHHVAPFSVGSLGVHLESRDGLTAMDLHLEGGAVWASDGGWRSELVGSLEAERVLAALNDRPISLFAVATYDPLAREGHVHAGLRVALVSSHRP